MSKAQELLDAATPLPWFAHRYDLVVDDTGGPIAEVEDSPANLALIVYAVNRLPDYEELAATFERLDDMLANDWIATDPDGGDIEWEKTWSKALAALRRLRDEVPAT